MSRATVRKVVRGEETEFKYERGVQPAPKLGAWVEDLTGILEAEVGASASGTAFDAAAFRGTARPRL